MTSFRGFPACSCLATWLPAYEAELKRRGILAKSGALRIYQLIGGAKASGGTHSKGGAFDILDLPGNDDIWVARQMGADATWSRRYNWDNRGGMAHVHGVLTGCPHNSPARYQIDDVRRGLNGLANHGRDDGPRPLSGRTWQQGVAWANSQAKAAAAAAKPPKPSKPSKPVVPWFNVSFSNTHWNSISGGKVAAVASTASTLAKDSAAGSPAVATFCEVRQSQLRLLDAEMQAHDYRRVAYAAENMLAAYVRPSVDFLGYSFARFSKQDGGNKEGVLRLKFRIDGSRAQIGVVHLDHDSPESYKRHNLKQAYSALRRYGIATLLPDWKSRTLIIGDFNDPDVAAKALKPLGFKQIDTDTPIDQAWVGAKRVVRGGSSSKTASDHKRILVRLGKTK